MGLKRYLAGGLAAVGGLMMVASGYSSRVFLYTALGYAVPQISNVLSGAAENVVVFAITVVELITALGGVSVLVGGLIVIAGHTTTGRTLVYLGGGAGFLGLLISFGYSIYRLGGLDPVLSYLPYWAGLALAIGGRRLAKGA